MTEAMPDKPTAFRPSPDWVHRPVDAAMRAVAAMSLGDQSALRRMHPHDLHHPAFWKLTTGVLAQALPDGDGERRAERERQWAVVLSVAAGALHSPATRLGSAIARAGVQEVRLTRLLRARGDQLADAVRTLAHQVVTAGLAFDVADLAWLVLSDGQRDEDSARQQIARDFYRAANAET